MMRNWKKRTLVAALVFFAGMAAQAQAQESPRRTSSREVAAPTDTETPWFIISGGVQRPGRFEMRGGATALEALRLAGGLTAPAKIEEVLIFRRTERDEIEVLAINLTHALRRGGRIDDLPLRQGDLVLVAEDARANLESYLKAARAGRLSHVLP